ncbi:hypothetical protein R1sor_024575 [Riccia sorocarpa]|uniref:Protein kinase domain-containing protein n=1 Tax=Riccia sorocarpa TaxID=122646 RepID=A0ABD3GWY2_9MARC
MRHAWFRWFVHETDLVGYRRLFWTPGTEVGRERFRGNCFVVGVRDPGLAKTLGAHDVVFYVAKRMLTIDRWRISSHAEAVREMSAFPISHPAICAPVGGILDDESPTLLFPWWNGGQISHWITRERELRWTRTANGLRREPPSEDVMVRYDTDTHLSESDRHDNKDIDPEGRRIIRKLVFVGIGDLGWAQTKDQAENGQFKPYLVGDRDPRAWVAPELTREKACPDWRGRKYITFFSESTDIYAMGYILENLCGDFFSDMTPRERFAYDDEMFAKGFPTGASLPHVVHGQRLREALDTMTTVNIANRIDHRRTTAHWETYFQEQLMVDPLVCQRPPETKPRQKKHPDGPREIGNDKL